MNQPVQSPATNTAVLERFVRSLEYDPSMGHAKLTATCEPRDGFRVAVRVRDHETLIDQPCAIGGHDDGPNPMELLLGTLGACQATTYRLWADRLGVALDSVEVEVSASLDLHGFLGATAAGADEGLSPIEVRVTLSGPDEPEAYAALRRTVDERSPAMQALRQPTTVRTLLRLG